MPKMVTIHQPGDKVYTMDEDGHLLEWVVWKTGDLIASSEVRTDEDVAADPETPGVTVVPPIDIADAQRASHAALARFLAGTGNRMVRIKVDEIDHWANHEVKIMKLTGNTIFVRLVTES